MTDYSTGLSANSTPVAIAAGAASTLWFADSVDRVGRVTLLDAPLANVSAATAITTTSATLNGTVNAQGASTSAHFEYGLTDRDTSSAASVATSRSRAARRRR